MAFKIFALVTLMAAFASADILPTYSSPLPPYDPPQPYPHVQPYQYSHPQPSRPAKYNFNYAVMDDYSGNHFGHKESRDGYSTHGSYHNNLPDGRTQYVDYKVEGDSGYLAQVRYEGEAHHPPTRYHPGPSYNTPLNY